MLIAGPNLTTDRVLSIDAIRPGEVLRFTDAHVAPGGKGVNVARAARALGIPAHVVVLAAGRTGRAVAELLDDEGLGATAIPMSGEVRAAVIIVEHGGRITVLNEPGPEISAAEWSRYAAAVTAAIRGSGHSDAGAKLLVCSGSVPPGAPPHAYAELVKAAHGASMSALVDASGPVLEAALAAGPDYVSPSLSEAEGVLYGRAGQEVEAGAPDARERSIEAARGIAERGARTALVTAGAAGVAAATRKQSLWMAAPRVAARNPIGAGDAFVANFAGAVEREQSLEGALAAGVAAGAASAETPLPGRPDPSRVQELLPQLAVQRFWKTSG